MPKQFNKEENLMCEKCAPRLGEILCPCITQNNVEKIAEKTVNKEDKSDKMVCPFSFEFIYPLNIFFCNVTPENEIYFFLIASEIKHKSVNTPFDLFIYIF